MKKYIDISKSQKEETSGAPTIQQLPLRLRDNRPRSVSQRQQSEQASASDPAQKEPNNTGLPDQLKSGIENLSGHSMDDVKVHYNSAKPTKLNAHAYAQGTNIHIASGQEKYLPHEAWHVVQQKQGRVQPTMQMKGKIKVNDDAGLEKEADVMGSKAIKKYLPTYPDAKQRPVTQSSVIQRQLQVVPHQPYYNDSRDGTNRRFTPVGIAHVGLTGIYRDQDGYNYYYDDTTKQYHVGNHTSVIYWDVGHQREYNKRTNLVHNLNCYEVGTDFNDRYYYRNFSYTRMPHKAKWVNAHQRFVEEVRPRRGVPYLRVLTDDGQFVQKHYIIGKDADRNYVLPVKRRQHFYAPNRAVFIPGLPNVFGGNMDPGDATAHATATREMHEETDFDYTTQGASQFINHIDDHGNRLHFHTGEVRRTIAPLEKGNLRAASAPFTQEMNIPMGQFIFKAHQIAYTHGVTTDGQIRTQILNLFSLQKGVNLTDAFFNNPVPRRAKTPLAEFHDAHTTQALVDKVKQDHTDYMAGKHRAQTGNPAQHPGNIEYMAGYDQYIAGRTRAQAGNPAQHLTEPAYMSGFDEYNQGLIDVSTNAPAANAHAAYMAARNEYTQGLTDVQRGAPAANAHIAYMTARDEYNQGMADGPGGVAANTHVAYMAGFNTADVHADKRRRA